MHEASFRISLRKHLHDDFPVHKMVTKGILNPSPSPRESGGPETELSESGICRCWQWRT